MASIGELTATVRADISGYVGSMRQVANVARETSVQVRQQGQFTSIAGLAMEQAGGHAEKFSGLLKKAQLAAFAASSEMAGMGGAVAHLAGKFTLLAGGGGILLAATAAIAGLVTLFRSGNEEAQKQADTVGELADAYREMTGQALQARKELAQNAVAEANRNTHLGVGVRRNALGVPFPVIEQVRDMKAVTEANAALLAAEAALTEFERTKRKPIIDALAKAEKERLEGLRAMGRELSQNLDLFGGGFLEQNILRVQKQIDQQRKLKQSLEDTAEAQRQALRAGLDKAGMGDIKDAARADAESARAIGQNAADSLAEAFVGQFRDQQQNFTQAIFSTLKAAIQEAISKLIIQNVFKALFSFVTGGASKGVSQGSDGGFISNLFGAPSASSAMGGPSTVVVPLSSMPRALTPIEQARDAMWQSVFTETSRTLQGNNVRLAVR